MTISRQFIEDYSALGSLLGEGNTKQRDFYLTADVFVHEQTVSKYVDVYTIGYGAEVPVTEPDAVPVAEPEAAEVFDADAELDEEDEEQAARRGALDLTTAESLRLVITYNHNRPVGKRS